MSNWFDNSQVIINSSGIMVDSLSVSSKNSVEGLRALGTKGIFQHAPRGPLTTNVSIEYYPEPANEPNFSRVSNWKQDISSNNYKPIQVELCGITGSGWIDRYTIRSSVNTPAKANASYVFYDELQGINSTGVTGIFDQTQISGVAHGWTTSLLPSNNTDTLYSEFEYNCIFDWKPIFAIGSKKPIQMQLAGVTESMSVTRNIFKPITFSGQAAHEYYDGVTGINVDVLQVLWGGASNPLTFCISGAPVVESDFSLNTNNYMTVKSTINKYS